MAYRLINEEEGIKLLSKNIYVGWERQRWLIAADSGPLIPTFVKARVDCPAAESTHPSVTPVIIKFARVVRRRAGNIAKGGQIYRFDYHFPENRDNFKQSPLPPHHLARVKSVIVHQADTHLSNEAR